MPTKLSADLTQSQKDQVIELLKSKPKPIPDKLVHDLADRLKVPTDELESYIYGIAQGSLINKIPGGLSEGKKPEDFDPKAVVKGVKVELEHTDDKALAAEIARDHLTEDKLYYDKLERMESGMCDKKAVSRVAARYIGKTADVVWTRELVLQKRGEPMWYGNGQFMGWRKASDPEAQAILKAVRFLLGWLQRTYPETEFTLDDRYAGRDYGIDTPATKAPFYLRSLVTVMRFPPDGWVLLLGGDRIGAFPANKLTGANLKRLFTRWITTHKDLAQKYLNAQTVLAVQEIKARYGSIDEWDDTNLTITLRLASTSPFSKEEVLQWLERHWDDVKSKAPNGPTPAEQQRWRTDREELDQDNYTDDPGDADSFEEWQSDRSDNPSGPGWISPRHIEFSNMEWLDYKQQGKAAVIEGVASQR